ncbi:sulfatase family protein [Pedobacter sp. ASV12]|uniref:sulfatase family protein n=1 Tax=Pedobacter sp. ASV12 TaxID=2795120 RepID=UPI001E5D4476|nr:sulfatase [Pedobacter sp. ASV12]
MNTKLNLKGISCMLACFLFGFFANPLWAQKQNRPNIVIIISDDHALSTIGAYGAKYGASPHIDQLAKQGVTFTNAFVNNSLCAPSRATLLTGKYSHVNGLRDNRDQFDAAQDVFPRRLQQAGFQTAWIGKWHLKNYPQGFDYWSILPDQGQYYNPDLIGMQGDTVRKEGYCTDIITNLTVDWLDKRDKTKPFCVIIGQKAPHRPWMPDARDLRRFEQVKFALPPNFYDDYQDRIAAQTQDMSIAKTMQLGYDLKMKNDPADPKSAMNATKRMNAVQQRAWNAYYDSVQNDMVKQQLSGKALIEWKYQRYMKDYLATTVSLDRNIGEIMDYLDKNKLSENTIVVYTSDQGFYMGEHGWFDKRFMYEESMHAPFIMRYPKVVKPHSKVSQLVSNVDFAPTFLDLAGVSVPKEIQGKSFVQVLKNGKEKIRESVYYHYYEFPAEHSVRKHFGIRTDRYKLIRFYGQQDFWEFYDLKTDPHEMKNLYNDKSKQALIATLKAKLLALTIENKDQLAEGILKKEN